MKEVSVLRSSFNGRELFHKGVVTNHISAFWDFLPTIGVIGAGGYSSKY